MGYAPICPPKLRAEERTWRYRIHAIFREIHISKETQTVPIGISMDELVILRLTTVPLLNSPFGIMPCST